MENYNTQEKIESLFNNLNSYLNIIDSYLDDLFYLGYEFKTIGYDKTYEKVNMSAKQIKLHLEIINSIITSKEKYK